MKGLAAKIITIEEEFNAPIKSVILSFAKAGHSISDTANILELNRSSLATIVREFNWDKYFCEPSQSLKNKEARAMGYNRDEKEKTKAWKEAVIKANFKRNAVEIEGVLDTLKGHAKRLGITYNAILYRKSRGLKLTNE